MSLQVNIHDAKSRLSALLAQVEAGEEVIIARANKPIARLVPYTPPQAPRRLGEAKGLVEMAPDFDELPDDFMAHFS
jgi:prevent-host-death family protein